MPLVFGRRIGIEFSPTLEEGSWLDLGNLQPDGEEMRFIDADAVRAGRERGFYRAFIRE